MLTIYRSRQFNFELEPDLQALSLPQLYNHYDVRFSEFCDNASIATGNPTSSCVTFLFYVCFVSLTCVGKHLGLHFSTKLKPYDEYI